MLKKLFIILLVLIAVLSLIPTRSLALGNVIEGAQKFISRGKHVPGRGAAPGQPGKVKTESLLNLSQISEASDILFVALFVIATAVAVIVGTILGIKFIMASVEEKAEIKQSLIPFVVGCVVVFGSLGIWRMVVSIAEKLD